MCVTFYQNEQSKLNDKRAPVQKCPGSELYCYLSNFCLVLAGCILNGLQNDRLYLERAARARCCKKRPLVDIGIVGRRDYGVQKSGTIDPVPVDFNM